MDIAVKKVELIEWLARIQDETLIQRIEKIKKGSIEEAYENRMPKTIEELQSKLDQSQLDIDSGRTYSQEEVKISFRGKFKK